MKCMDCLPLIEEFFDGEVDNKTGERMRGHLASCMECSEAFDALRAEQELFLRYDRQLEVTPALWQGVRMRIAEERPQPRQPFLLRLREQLAATVAVFSMQPALAGSLALVLIGVTAGALWLMRSTNPAPTTTAVVQSPEVTTTRGAPLKTHSEISAAHPGAVVDVASAAPVAIREGRESHAAFTRNESRPKGRSNEVVALKLHEVDDDSPVIATSVLDDLADAAAMLNPEDEAVARHVEKAQILLRSFKNTRPAEGEGDIAYERELSRTLLDENISLRLEAEASGNKTANRVLRSLEPFLQDISNLQTRPSRGDVRSIKDRMEKQEIIAALHVYDD